MTRIFRIARIYWDVILSEVHVLCPVRRQADVTRQSRQHQVTPSDKSKATEGMALPQDLNGMI